MSREHGGWSKHIEDAIGGYGALPSQETLDKSSEDFFGDESDEKQETAGFDQAQVADFAEKSLDFLSALAMPSIVEFGFPPVLQAAWSLLVQSSSAVGRSPQLALGIPRGHAKTTLLKLYCLWTILFSRRKFILIVCATEDLAVHIISDIMDMLTEPNILATFGDWRVGAETNRQDLKKFGFRGRNIILAGIGVSGSLRGMNIKNSRPDVMIFDDIQTREAADSKLQSDAVETWMIGTAMKAKAPTGCLFIFAGNMYPTPNSILKKLQNNPSWVKFISGAILADGTALWPDLRSLESLVEEFENDMRMGHPEIFFSEVMNDTEAGVNSRVDFSQLAVWKWREHEFPQGKFLIIDPATDKARSDLTAIGYCEVFDGVPAFRQVIEERLSPGNTIRRALALALNTGTRVIVVESTAYQSTLLYWFNLIMAEKGITGIYVVEIHPGSISKNSRISTMLKSLSAGEIVLHPTIVSQVTHQIANWNPLKRDNTDGVLDLLTYSLPILKTFEHIIGTYADEPSSEYSLAKVEEGAWAF